MSKARCLSDRLVALVHRFCRIHALGNSRERISGLGGVQETRLVPRRMASTRTRSMRRFDGIAALVLLFGQASVATAAEPQAPPLALPGTDGVHHLLRQEIAQHSFTVLVFFSAHCPCQKAHDERLRELFRDVHSRGVQVFAVDSEAGSSLQTDRAEASQRHYPFPILYDAGAQLADALRAEYATFAVVFDQQGRIRYRGGLDSDRSHLRVDARAYLRDSLNQLLSGGPAAAVIEQKTLGCVLRRR